MSEKNKQPDFKQLVREQIASASLSPMRETEIVEELSQHLSDRYDERVGSGVTPETAYRTVSEELEAHELIQQLRRVEQAQMEPPTLGAPRGSVLGGLWYDLRYAVRLLRLNPTFTIVAVMSLALGIGANTAMFQLLDSVRLSALPVDRPQELSILKLERNHWAMGNFHGDHSDFTNPLWEQIRAAQQGFSQIFAWSTEDMNMAPGGEMRIAKGLLVSGQFFQTLGVTPLLGRVLTEADDVKGCGASAAVVSYPFWRRQFGGDPSVIGRKLTLEGQAFEVVGVTPPSFYGVEVGKTFDVAVPLCTDAVLNGEGSSLDKRATWWLGVMGRLKPGWTIEKAAAQLQAVSPAIMQSTIPETYTADSVKKYLKYSLTAKPGANGFSNLREEYENPLLLLLAIAGFVLLIACANLANLMLARATAREREIAIRLALGADRRRLIRQLLTESLLLAFVGAASGVLLARFLSQFMVAFLDTQDNPVFMNVGLDWRVLGFTAALAVITCILFGLTPALKVTRTAPSVAMSVGGRSTAARHERFGLRRVLVIAQIAFSLVLLITAFLFVHSLQILMHEDAGFRRDGILVADLDLSHLSLPVSERVQFKQQVVDRIVAIPHVTSAASTSVVPANGRVWNESVLSADEGEKAISDFTAVTPEYFETMGTALLAGRNFDGRDTATSPKVAIVNKEFARKVFDGQNPIGKTFRIKVDAGEAERSFEVVGVAQDSKSSSLRSEFGPITFIPAMQDIDPRLSQHLVIRSDAPTLALVEQVKQGLHDVDPNIAVQFRRFDTQIKDSLLRERLMATLSGSFGFLAGILAVVGIYGVISYMVVRRTNEIGIRMALGASRGDILRLIMSEAGTLLGVGLMIGTALAFIAGRAATSLLYGLKATDVATYAMAIGALTTVTCAASLLPAGRAAKLDPMVALRDE